MRKTLYPAGGVPIPVQNNATTVGPQVTQTITVSPRLEALTHCGVYEEGGSRLRLYRKSSTVPGTLSCEVYFPQGGGWVRHHEERVKYAPPDELFPPDAKRLNVDGVPCASLEDFTPAQVEVLRELLRRDPA